MTMKMNESMTSSLHAPLPAVATLSLVDPVGHLGSVTQSAAIAPLSAFTGIGIELEYMIVDQQTLQPLPIADRLLARGSGNPGVFTTDVVRGAYGWSNELVMHVIEIKNLCPAPTLCGLAADFTARGAGQI